MVGTGLSQKSLTQSGHKIKLYLVIFVTSLVSLVVKGENHKGREDFHKGHKAFLSAFLCVPCDKKGKTTRDTRVSQRAQSLS